MVRKINEVYFPDRYISPIDNQLYCIEWDDNKKLFKAPVRCAHKWVFGKTAEEVMDEIDKTVADCIDTKESIDEDLMVDGNVLKNAVRMAKSNIQDTGLKYWNRQGNDLSETDFEKLGTDLDNIITSATKLKGLIRDVKSEIYN